MQQRYKLQRNEIQTQCLYFARQVLQLPYCCVTKTRLSLFLDRTKIPLRSHRIHNNSVSRYINHVSGVALFFKKKKKKRPLVLATFTYRLRNPLNGPSNPDGSDVISFPSSPPARFHTKYTYRALISHLALCYPCIRCCMICPFALATGTYNSVKRLEKSNNPSCKHVILL